MSIPPPTPDGSRPQSAGAPRKASARLNWIIGSSAVFMVAGMFALGLFAPRLFDHLYALGLLIIFPASAVGSFRNALTQFRKGSVFMGILLLLSAGVLLLSTIFPLMALFP